jgi:hypothetical protein
LKTIGSGRAFPATQNTELIEHCGVDHAVQIMEAIRGLLSGRFALVVRNPASDHFFVFVHAPLIIGDVDQLSNGSEETLRAICASEAKVSSFTHGDIFMRCAKHPVIRNKIDLTDPNQVRAWKRRLGVSTDDLQRVVEKVGESISAVNKEIELERATCKHRSGDDQAPLFLKEIV